MQRANPSITIRGNDCQLVTFDIPRRVAVEVAEGLCRYDRFETVELYDPANFVGVTNGVPRYEPARWILTLCGHASTWTPTSCHSADRAEPVAPPQPAAC